MKTFLFLSVAAALALASCNTKPEYNITGAVSNAELNGKTVYLYEYDIKEPVVLDSAIVQDGAFAFKGAVETPTLAILTFSQADVPPVRTPTGMSQPFSTHFVLENAKLQAELDSFSVVIGTQENNDYNVLRKEVKDLQEKITPLLPDLRSEDKAVSEAAGKKYEEIDSTVTAAVRKYIDSNPTRLTSGKLLFDYRYNFDEDEQNAIIAAADSTFKSVPGIDKIIERLEVLKTVAVGKKFADFEQPNVKGETHKLSEYVGNGKIALIDFWASWCPPCRAEMPNLVALYQQYKGKGFEIVGVSLDSKQEAWEKGIKDLKITWPQLSDLEGWKNSGAALYAVNSIPHTVLVDKDGTILAKDLRGDELKAKLAELLK